jgi:hypothetical protein
VVGYETIREDFEKLRDFFLNDLDGILSLDVGGNYAVAVLVGIACEEIARVRHGEPKGERVFAEMLPEEWRPVAPSLYDAVRDGLAHRYEPSVLVLDGGDQIEVAISWREREHLSVEGRTVFLNAVELVADLRDNFVEYQAALRKDADLRDRFVKHWSYGRFVKRVKGQSEADAWKRLVPGVPSEITVFTATDKRLSSRP